MRAILGLIYLMAIIAAILDCVKSDKNTKGKVIWILITLFIPYVGAILYFVIGKKK